MSGFLRIKATKIGVNSGASSEHFITSEVKYS